MFKVVKEKFGKFTKVKLFNSKTKEYVSIIPQFGGNVNEIVLQKEGKLFSILNGDKNYNELVKNKWYKGAKLVPFPNRINNGVYKHNNQIYSLPINFPAQKHAIHGLTYCKSFKILKKTISKSKSSVTIEYEGKKLEGYPFNFLVTVEYSLTSTGFKCKTSILNKDNVKIPVGDGWHPYFTFKSKVDDLYLKIPCTKKISVNNRMIPTGKKVVMKIFAKMNKIKNQNFDTGFVISKRGIVYSEILNQKSNVTIQIWQETGKK